MSVWTLLSFCRVVEKTRVLNEERKKLAAMAAAAHATTREANTPVGSGRRRSPPPPPPLQARGDAGNDMGRGRLCHARAYVVCYARPAERRERARPMRTADGNCSLAQYSIIISHLQ